MDPSKYAALEALLRSKFSTTEEVIQKGKLICGKGNCPPALLPWISEIQIHTPHCIHDKAKSLFNILQTRTSNMRLWTLAQFSVPPIFHTKYHKIDIKKLIENSTHSNYIALASVFTLWHEAYGVPLLNVLHQKHEAYLKFDTGSETHDWAKNMYIITRVLRLSWEGMDIRKYIDHDLCNNASDFLLEPSIIIQLPMKPILFHQWLAAALSEILLFERISLQLRHWPLVKKVLEVTKSTIMMVRQLKERVMLGFAILNEQVVSYPRTNDLHPKYILDNVVLPSLPVLKFLCDGKASGVIEALQKGVSNDTDDAHYLPPECHALDPALARLHATFMYNFHMWGLEKIPTLYPQLEEKVENIISRINTEKPEESNSVNNTKPLSIDEKHLLEYAKKNYEHRPGEEIKLVFELLEILIAENYIKNVDLQTAKKFFNTPANKKKCKQIFNLKIQNDNLLNAIRQAMLWSQVSKMLVQPENYHDIESIASQLIIFQLQVLESEQLSRFVNTCHLIFKNPMKDECFVKIEVSKINKTIKKLRENVLTSNREVLVNQLPEAWVKTDSSEEEEDIMEDDGDENYIDIAEMDDIIEPEGVFEATENRIGKLLVSIATNTIDIVGKGNAYFPDSNFIHFLLPSMLASLYEDYKSTKKINKEYLKLIHALIELFQNKLDKWLIDPNIKNDEAEIPIEQENLLKNPSFTPLAFQIKEEWPCLNLKLREMVRQMIGCKVLNSGSYFKYIFGIDKIINNTHDYASMMGTEDICVQYACLLHKLSATGFRFSYYLVSAAYNAFNIPIPGTLIPNYPQLSQLYFTSSVLSELQTVFEMTKQYIDPKDTRAIDDAGIEIETHDVFTDQIKQLRYDILQKVLNTDQPESKLQPFIDKSKSELMKTYDQLKKYRKCRSVLRAKLLQILPQSALPFMTHKFKSAIKLYIEGKLNELDTKLASQIQPLKSLPAVKIVKQTMNKKVKEGRYCIQCGKSESVRRLVVCEKCIQDKYPHVNYYCGRRCQAKRWKSEHMVEHLEFDLGLGEFHRK